MSSDSESSSSEEPRGEDTSYSTGASRSYDDEEDSTFVSRSSRSREVLGAVEGVMNHQEVGGVIHHQILQGLPMIGRHHHHLAPIAVEVVLLVPDRLAHLTEVDLHPMMTMTNRKRIILLIRIYQKGASLNDLIIQKGEQSSKDYTSGSDGTYESQNRTNVSQLQTSHTDLSKDYTSGSDSTYESQERTTSFSRRPSVSYRIKQGLY